MAKLMDIIGRVFNHRSTQELYNVTTCIDNKINGASSDVATLQNLEFNISTAEGTWLDEWGSWFGVPRLLNEPDSAYSIRIKSVAIKPKNTIKALAKAIQDYVGDPNLIVDVYEPYKDIFKYEYSKYDSVASYQDSIYMRFGVVDIKTTIEATPGLMDILNQVKSAGIKIYVSKPCPVKLSNPNDVPPVPVDLNDWSTWYGTKFGVYQIPDEGLSDYKQRIISTATNSEQNLVKLADYIQSNTNNSNLVVTTEQNSENIFIYGQSYYDGVDTYPKKPIIKLTTPTDILTGQLAQNPTGFLYEESNYEGTNRVDPDSSITPGDTVTLSQNVQEIISLVKDAGIAVDTSTSITDA